MKSDPVQSVLCALRARWLVALIVFAIGLLILPFMAKIIPAYKATVSVMTVSEGAKDATLADQTLPSIVTSNEVLQRVIRRFNLPFDTIELAKKIKATIPTKSAIVELSYKDTDGDRAAAVINDVADEAAVFYHDIATRGYTETMNDLVSKAAVAKATVADYDRQLQRASARNAVASSDNALSDLTTQFDALRAQRNLISSTLAADGSMANSLHAEPAAIAPIVRGEILQKDPEYIQVQSTVAKDEADVVAEQATFRDTFPGLRALERRTKLERTELQSVGNDAVANGAGLSPSYSKVILDAKTADATVAADRERLRAVDSEINLEEQHLQQVAGASAQVGTLRAEHDAALAQYTALVQRIAQAQGDAAQAASLGSLIVVSRAVPPRSQLSIWILAMLFGLATVAVFAAWITEKIDRRLWGADEMETLYGRPVLLRVGAR